MLEFFSDYSIYIYVTYIAISIGLVYFIDNRDEKLKEVKSLVTNAIQILVLVVWLPSQVNNYLSSSVSKKAELLSPLLKINKEMFRRSAIVSRLSVLGERKLIDEEVNMLLKELNKDNNYYVHMSKIVELAPIASLKDENKKILKNYIQYTDTFMKDVNIEYLKILNNFECYIQVCDLKKRFEKSLSNVQKLKDETTEIGKFTKVLNEEAFKESN